MFHGDSDPQTPAFLIHSGEVHQEGVCLGHVRVVLALGDVRKMLLRQHCQLLPTHISPPVVTESTAAEKEEKVTHLFSGSPINKVNPFIFCTGVPQDHCGSRIPMQCYWMHTGAPADLSDSEHKRPHSRE